MDCVKIIDLSSSKNNKSRKKLTKKQMYKEILSSSDTVKEIINNRKKTRRFDYLNTIPTINSMPNPLNSSTEKSKESNKSIESKEAKESNKSRDSLDIPKKQNTIVNYFKVKENEDESIQNKELKQENNTPNNVKKIKQKRKKSVSFKNIKPKQKLESKQAIKPITQILNQQNIPQKSILKTTRRMSQPKRFTEKQIVEILGILIKLNKLGHINKIHKTIRRINIVQTNQLLFALRMIKQYSNAPERMLKTTLFNYITGDVCIKRQ